LIVVDTSVWIDLFRGRDTEAVGRCLSLIQEGAPVGLTDIVLTEILQGIGSDAEAQRLESQMRAFPILRLDSIEDFSLAAALHRKTRAAGVKVRKTLDCLIAAPCVRADVPILHSDSDFDRLASCTPLRIFS
jgi:predicted nucleic acid-binding protein